MDLVLERRSMDLVHSDGPSPYFDGPGPWRGSMDQGPCFVHSLIINLQVFLCFVSSKWITSGQ